MSSAAERDDAATLAALDKIILSREKELAAPHAKRRNLAAKIDKRREAEK